MVQGHQLTLYLLGCCPVAAPSWEMSVLLGQAGSIAGLVLGAGGSGLSVAPPDANWGCAHGMAHRQPDPIRRWVWPSLAAQGGL